MSLHNINTHKNSKYNHLSKVFLIFEVVKSPSKNICIYSAYALVPYIFCTFVAVFLSNFLVQAEGIWVYFIQYVGLGWSLVLMIQAMRAVHQYTFGKTLLSMVMTIVAMLIILFLAILLLSLFQQLYVFVYSIYTEIAYRIRG